MRGLYTLHFREPGQLPAAMGVEAVSSTFNEYFYFVVDSSKTDVKWRKLDAFVNTLEQLPEKTLYFNEYATPKMKDTLAGNLVQMISDTKGDNCACTKAHMRYSGRWSF